MSNTSSSHARNLWDDGVPSHSGLFAEYSTLRLTHHLNFSVPEFFQGCESVNRHDEPGKSTVQDQGLSLGQDEE